jgi:hypothetical protein
MRAIVTINAALSRVRVPLLHTIDLLLAMTVQADCKLCPSFTVLSQYAQFQQESRQTARLPSLWLIIPFKGNDQSTSILTMIL